MRLLTDAKCLRVIDGDTILVMMVCPCCRICSQQRVRLARLDAPELKGPQACQGLTAKLALAAMIEGRDVKLGVKKTWPDKYGRVIAEVYHDGVNVTDRMVHLHYGTFWISNQNAVVRIGDAITIFPDTVKPGDVLPPLADVEDGETWPQQPSPGTTADDGQEPLSGPGYLII